MQPTVAVAERLVRRPCAKCGLTSAFIGAQGLCPSCRAEALEREFGLRPGLLRELAMLSSRAITQTEERKPRRVARGRAPRAVRGRSVGVA